MLYLIDQHIWLLLVVAALAAMGGWAYSAMKERPREADAQRERERLMREVLSASESGAPAAASPELEREMDTLRRRADLDAARIAEMERALEGARSRADDASARAAQAERSLEGVSADGEELQRLRLQAATAAEQEQRTVDVQPLAAPVSDEEQAAQAWRLRYFEHRVRYLEGQQRAAPQPAPALAAPVAVQASNGRELMKLDWRARYAEARARHLEQALRDANTTQPEPAPAPEPLAAPEPVRDELADWRMSYLEKRLAHAQQPAPADDGRAALELEAEKLKWRNRYLEARTRRLDSLLAAKPEPAADASLEPLTQSPEPVEPEAMEAPPAAPQPVMQAPAPADAHGDDEEPIPAPLVPAGSEERPPSLPAARNGAPDDFTLIDDISPMLQRTLHSLGIYHFEQIAAWTPANVAWVDQYLRLRGRIVQEDWIDQAADLAREGPAAARRMLEDEMA